ncbi:protein-glutamate methylesterase/protein-glutamine glutaminase [Roseiconus lacunae]|uniref:protein-glutamate methylesterase/protein-glutamine glutaminase n=1 Tax=Roseiconus lacunae TaxID=2605694 RepID=UPI0011F10BBA|nr:chemotaxis response regulator protein-glutamate methylesterase [Roseiconus lacunae]
MSNEIRVLLCDDSSVMRRLLKASMQSEPRLNVVFEAENGLEAVSNVTKVKPDVIIMDVEMPVMDGVDAVREIRKLSRTVPIIMFSSLTSRGAEASFDAIEAGASDFATKPIGAGHISKAMASVRRDLIPKVMQWAQPHVQPVLSKLEQVNPSSIQAAPSPAPASIPAVGSQSDSVRPLVKSAGGIAAVGVGVSTGGPQALMKLLGGLPKDFSTPILITQHMPPVFTGLLAGRLASQTGRPIREATDGESLSSGAVLIAPGDYHMTVARVQSTVVVKLDQNPPVNSCRPSVDPMFDSLADCFGNQTLGVILTGMGQDGMNGAKRLRDCGAPVIAQDEQSSVVWGMPGQIVKAGLATKVLPIDQMANEVTRIVLAEKSASTI